MAGRGAAALAFMAWTAKGPRGRPGYGPLTLPAVGETVPLTAVDFLDALQSQ